MLLTLPKSSILRVFLVSICMIISMSAFGAATQIVYPRPELPDDARGTYPIKVLRLALQNSGNNYTLEPSPTTMLQGRAILQLKNNVDINVFWTIPDPDREAGLIRVPVPFDKGLIGWRLLLIKQDRLAEFAQLKLPAGLKALKAGQGHDWPDVSILRSNGFTVAQVVGYDALFRLLDQGTIDYFPRSVSEIGAEAAEHQAQGTVIEPTIVLHYPSAFYFYVNKDRSDLAKDLETGLKKIIADGSFDKLFHQTFDAELASVKLKDRHILELTNPKFPNDPGGLQKKFWFYP